MTEHKHIQHLILGGARSGKSAYAEASAIEHATQHKFDLIYIATATAGDAEMAARIKRHQSDRDGSWRVREESIKLATTIDSIQKPSVILIDCLTLWLSNCLHQSATVWQQQKKAFTDALLDCQHTVIMVSNEVGHGIIPMGELARNYVDEIGWLHQALAQQCDQATMLIAGLPQKLK